MKAEAGVHWLNAEQAARHLGFVRPDGTVMLKAFQKWKERKKPRAYRLGKKLRFRQVDLDRCVEPEPEIAESEPLRLVRGRR